MSALLLLVRSAFTRRRAGSIAVVGVVTALAAAGLCAALVVTGDASARIDGAFERHRGPHLVTRTADDDATTVAASLRSDPAVVAIDGPRPAIAGELAIAGESVDVVLREAEPTGGEAVSPPVLVAGRLATAPGELVLDAGVADRHDVRVGDAVEVSAPVAGTPHRTATTVVGLAYDFVDCFYPACDPARAWVAPGALRTLGAPSFAVVAARVAPGEEPDAVVDRLRSDVADAVLGSNTWPDTRADLLVETDFFGAFLGAFGVAVLIASAVVVLGTITARTVTRRRSVARCRALGMASRQVGLAIVAEHVIVSLAACLAGGAVALAVAPRLRVGSLRIIEAGAAGVPLDAVAVSTAVVLVLVVVATVGPAWRAARAPIVAGLRDAPSARAAGRGSLLAATARALRLPLSVEMGARAALARPLRSGLAAAAVVVAVVAALVTTSIGRSVDHILDHPELAGDPADVVLEPPADVRPTEVDRQLTAMPSVAGWYSFVDDVAEIDGRSVHVRMIDGPAAATAYVIGDGSAASRPGDAIAGFGLMESIGWRVGDTVEAEIGGELLRLSLRGWYRETEDGGEVLQVRGARHVDDETVAYGVLAVDGVTPDALALDLSSAFGDAARVEPNEPDRATTRPFTVALDVMSAVIAAIALANLVAAAAVTARERARRTGALRAMGMSRWSLVVETAAHALVIAAAALVVGIPLGWLASSAVGDLLTSELGAGPGLTLDPGIGTSAAVALGAVVVAASCALVVQLPVLRRRPAVLLHED